MKLKKVYSTIVPFKGYTAFTFLPWVFIRESYKDRFTPTVERHENTHGYQQLEMLILGILIAIALYFIGCGWWSLITIPLFFEQYFLEWAIKIPFCGWNTDKAYKSISSEQEAYYNQKDEDYNSNRKHFAWVRYIFKLYKKQ